MEDVSNDPDKPWDYYNLGSNSNINAEFLVKIEKKVR
jgi:hypothetical protein